MPSPNPSWTPKSKITPPASSEQKLSLTASGLAPQELYRILISTVIPRPIALISTTSSEGKNNLAPFSFFNAVGSNPPALMIAIAAKPDGGVKDTLRNILDTGEFVVNSANEWLIEPLVYTAGSFEYGVDEMAEVGLTAIASEMVKPPRVKEAAAQFECSLYSTTQVGDGSPGSSTVVIGKIEKIHIASSIYDGGKVDADGLKPIARLGGISYTTLGERFEIAIPQIRSS